VSAIPFAVIGAGWRSEFYLRIARALPERFRVTSVMTRDATRAARVTTAFAAPVRATIDEVLTDHPAFVVACVPREAAPGLLRELAAQDAAVLAETPPAADLDALAQLADLAGSSARIQVAEQYQFQPLHAARLGLVRSGRLGTVTEAHVSVAHDYHGIDLIRRYLAVGMRPVTIVARRFVSPLATGPGRSGPPAEDRTEPSERILAWLDFGDRLGIYDFAMEQYFSWIRSPGVVLRGDRGEIRDSTLRALRDVHSPYVVQLTRRDMGHDGNLEGLYHAGITLGDEWVYRNPFAPARLSDDEIAIATCLSKMAEYREGGTGFCSLAEAAWDHELAIRLGEAVASGAPVRVAGTAWEGTSSGPVGRRRRQPR
jgi:hypothetical protein